MKRQVFSQASSAQHEIDQTIEKAYQLFFMSDMSRVEELSRRALALAASAEPGEIARHSLAAIKMVQAMEQMESGLPGDILSLCLEAITYLNEDDDPKIRIRTLNVLAYTYLLGLQLGPALDYATQGQELCEELGLVEERIAINNTMAAIYNNLHDYRSSLELLAGALELADRFGNDVQKISSLHNQALCFLLMGRVAEAEPGIERALDICERLNAQKMKYQVLMVKAVCLMEQNKLQEARDLVLYAIDGLSTLKLFPRIAEYYGLMALIHLRLGELELAKKAVDRALEVSDSFDSQIRQPNFYMTLRAYYEMRGEYQKALEATDMVTAWEKFRRLHVGRNFFSTSLLKYPPAAGASLDERGQEIRSAFKFESTTGLLNSLTFFSLGDRYFKQFSDRIPDCQLLILSITGGLDMVTLEPTDLQMDTLNRIIEGLVKFIRLSDLATRLPGGHFMVLMPRISTAEVEAVMERIRAYFSNSEDQSFLLQYLNLGLFRSQPEVSDRTFTHFVNRSLLKTL